ncbi:Hypothetical_protein [Hexamita inflata]|uniref:Hypothetical_protein n=1 Tax=Hexamita inflata TaxID=28002 RepID=A0AA86NF62_9EUKA|nr:Hypothetical protein HINF_LOCUS6129 [Hexamita inflata]
MNYILSISNRNSLLLLLLGGGLLVVLGVLWLLVLLWLLFLHGNMRGGRDNRIRPDSTQIMVRRRFIANPNSDWIRQILRFKNARRGGKRLQRRNRVYTGFSQCITHLIPEGQRIQIQI